MKQSPLSINIIGWIYIGAGVVGLAYHWPDLVTEGHSRLEAVLVCLVRALAVVGGVFLLRGSNWARWLLLAWLAYHVVLSAFHSVSEVVMHSLLLAVIGYFLLRRQATDHFRRGGSSQEERIEVTDP